MSDERVKNERELTVKTIERITGESAAIITLEHPAATKSVKAIKFKKTRQYLSDSLDKWRVEQKEKKKETLGLLGASRM